MGLISETADARRLRLDALSRPDSLLLTDLYQLNMMQAYFDRGMMEPAVFELFIRKLPDRRGFFLAAGLEQAADFLEAMRLTEEERAWAESSGRFSRAFLDWLSELRFDGDLHAIPEGTVVFPDEPFLRVTAPLPVAQLVESRLLATLQAQIVVASKAARIVLAAEGRTVVDFGLRRANGTEAGLLAARAAYVAGCAGTATVLAEPAFGIPIFGTMAHSFVQAHDDEMDAFRHYARSRPDQTTLLIDTYDTEGAAEKVVALARELAAEGITIRGVRIDSGDLADHARKVRKILDDGGLTDALIFASGGLDEDRIARMVGEGAPIDGFGVGSSLVTSTDAPTLDTAYKLQEYAGLARRKQSEGKATWPGRKQVWRRYGDDGRMVGDLLTLDSEPGPDGAEALVRPVIENGRRIEGRPGLEDARARAADQLKRLPEPLARLGTERYPVEIGGPLEDLAREVDRRIAAGRQG